MQAYIHGGAVTTRQPSSFVSGPPILKWRLWKETRSGVGDVHDGIHLFRRPGGCISAANGGAWLPRMVAALPIMKSYQASNAPLSRTKPAQFQFATFLLACIEILAL